MNGTIRGTKIPVNENTTDSALEKTPTKGLIAQHLNLKNYT